MRNKRFAGAKLILEPIGDVSEQLKASLDRLRGLKPNYDDRSYQSPAENAPVINKSFEVDGHSVHLNARPAPINYDIPETIDQKVIGNTVEIKQLLENPPTVEYSLTWDVDGGYTEGADMDRRTKLRIAREVQRQWASELKKLPDNALVVNSPVGAGQGDFGRADVYMSAGFGPVQETGQQYGIMRGGEIQPLSPFMPQNAHVRHLAKKARMAGDVDLEQAMLAANRANDTLDFSNSMQLENAKGYRGGGYDDGDGYYDDDYEPPMRKQDLEHMRGRVLDNQSVGGYTAGGPQVGIPEIIERESLMRDLSRTGLDPQDFRRRPGVEADGVRRFGLEEFSGSQVQQLRDAQMELMQRPSAGRGFADDVQAIMPRPLPQQITVSDLEAGRDRRRGGGDFTVTGADMRSIGELEQLPPDQRLDAARQVMRREVDEMVGSPWNGPLREGAMARDDLKNVMVDQQRQGDLLIQQELFSAADVADLRALQEAAAIRGVLDTQEQERATRRRVSGGGRFGRRLADDGPIGRGKGGNIDPLPVGQMVERRRQLTPVQQEAARREQRRNQQLPADERAAQGLSLLDDRFNAQGISGVQQNPMYLIYGARSRDELVRNMGVTGPNPQMSNRQALRIIEQGAEQPGRVSSEELAQAIVNVQAAGPQIGNDPQSMFDRQLLGQAARGPAAPVGRPLQSGVTAPFTPQSGVGEERNRRMRAEREAQYTRRSQQDSYDDAPPDMNFSEFQEWNSQRRDAPLPQGQRLDGMEDVEVRGGVRQGPSILNAALARPMRPEPAQQPRRRASRRPPQFPVQVDAPGVAEVEAAAAQINQASRIPRGVRPAPPIDEVPEIPGSPNEGNRWSHVPPHLLI